MSTNLNTYSFVRQDYGCQADTTETNSGLDEIAEKIVKEMLEYSSMDFNDEEQFIHNRRVTYVKDLIKQALFATTEQLRAEKKMLSMELVAIQTGLEKEWFGKPQTGEQTTPSGDTVSDFTTIMAHHSKVEAERDLAQQRLVKLAKAVKDEISSQTRCSILSKEILSGNFETFDKMV